MNQNQLKDFAYHYYLQCELDSNQRPKKRFKTSKWTIALKEQLLEHSNLLSEKLGKPLEELTVEDIQPVSKNLRKFPKDCLQKLQEVMSTGTVKNNNWLETEDKIVLQFPGEKWAKVANIINETCHKGKKVRNGRSVKQRWFNHLNPELKKGPWTLNEDIKLIKLYLKFGKAWHNYTEEVKNRSRSSIISRVSSLESSARSKVTVEEDETSLFSALLKDKQEELKALNTG